MAAVSAGAHVTSEAPKATQPRHAFLAALIISVVLCLSFPEQAPVAPRFGDVRREHAVHDMQTMTQRWLLNPLGVISTMFVAVFVSLRAIRDLASAAVLAFGYSRVLPTAIALADITLFAGFVSPSDINPCGHRDSASRVGAAGFTAVFAAVGGLSELGFSSDVLFLLLRCSSRCQYSREAHHLEGERRSHMGICSPRRIEFRLDYCCSVNISGISAALVMR